MWSTSASVMRHSGTCAATGPQLTAQALPWLEELVQLINLLAQACRLAETAAGACAGCSAEQSPPLLHELLPSRTPERVQTRPQNLTVQVSD